jgi:hypothetical protein
LLGSKIKGIDYDFPTVSLKPNEFYVVSEYYEDFLAVYGVPPNDTHIGPARNKNEGQDTIELVDSLGILELRVISLIK